MKEIKLTKGFVALVDDADYEYLNQWKWQVSPCLNTQYARRSYREAGKLKSVSMHRVLIGVNDRNVSVDHIDHNGLNNQRSNLRLCSHSENHMNQLPRKGRLSKYKGVGLWRNKKYTYWNARIRVKGSLKNLGYFKTEEEAALAYNNAAIKYNGEFSFLNSITPETA